MKLQQCPSPQQLSDYNLGKLDRADLESVANHLDECRTCDSQLDQLESQADDFIEQIRKPVPEDFVGDDTEMLHLVHNAEALLDTSVELTATTSTQHQGGQKVTEADLKQMLSPPEDADEIGRLGGYRIVEVLGVGGMGVVFRAEDPDLQRSVALKVMLPAVASSSPSAKERFLREARATAAIEHDHIVTIHQVGEDRDVPFLAMQLLTGESLATRLKREKALPVTDVLKIGREICLGLQAAHRQGLTHRDIKPDNIWLESGSGRVKLVDFGLARTADDQSNLTQSGAIVGTPSFLAPEQARGEPVDHRADLFSVGVVLYQMITGKSPFARANLMATLHAVTLEEADPPAEFDAAIPTALSDLIMKLLDKNPEQRFQTADDVIEYLQPIDKQAEPNSKPTSPQVTTATPFRLTGRGKALVAIAAAALVLVMAAVIYVKTDYGTLVVKAGKDFEVTADHQTITIRDKKTDRKLTVSVGQVKPLPSGDYVIRVKDNDGLKFSTKEFKILRGGDEDLVVSMLPPRPTTTDPAPSENDFVPGNPISPLAIVQNPIELNGEKVPYTIATVAPFGQTLTSVRPDGQQVASFSADGAIRIWDSKTAKLQGIFFGPSAGPVSGELLVWNSDGDRLATTDKNNDLWVLATDSGEMSEVHTAQQATLKSFAWSPQGHHLAASFDDGSFRIWNSESWELLPVMQHLEQSQFNFAWSPDGKTVATTLHYKPHLYLWNVDSGTARQLTSPDSTGHHSSHAMTWSPDGSKFASISSGSKVSVWNLANGQIEQRFTAEYPNCVAWSEDGTMLAAGCSSPSDGSNLIVWDVNDGQERFSTVVGGIRRGMRVRWKNSDKAIEVASGESLGTVNVATHSFQLATTTLQNLSPQSSTDGKTVSGSMGSQVWISVEGKVRTVPGAGESLTSIACSPDQRFLVASDLNSLTHLHIWNLSDGVYARGSGGASAMGLAWSPDSKLIFHDHQIWDLAKSDPVTDLKNTEMTIPRATAWSPDGTRVAVAQAWGYDPRIIEIHDAISGELIMTHKARSFRDIAWSPDGGFLAIGDEQIEFLATDSETKLGVLEGFGKDHQVLCFSISRDGRYLVAAAQYNGMDSLAQQVHPTCIVWDLETRKPKHQLFDQEIGTYVVAFSADSKTIAIRMSNSEVRLLDVETGKVIRTTKGMGLASGADLFSPDLETLFTFESGFLVPVVIRLWNVTDGSLRGTLIPNQAPQLPLAISAEGHYQATGDATEEIRYVVKTEQGQKTLTPFEFKQQYGWQNDPSKVRFLSTLESDGEKQ